jgi:5-methylcytosine-specific restriction endonuclease McrBC regulatory subunit McrC
MSGVAPGLFDRLEEDRAAPGQRIRIVDGGRISLPLNATQREIICAQEPGKLATLGLSIQHEANSSGIETRIKTGSFVGAARFVSGKHALDVIVEPKVGMAPLFRMLRAVDVDIRGLEDPIQLGSSHEELPELWVNYVISRLEDFLRRHFYRDYVSVLAPDSSILRGRLLTGHYLRNQVPQLKPHRVPCEYFEYSQDTIENQIILAAVSKLGRLLGLVKSSNRQHYARRVAALRSALADVSDKTIRCSDIDNINYHRGNDQFKAVHKICHLIISSCSASLNPGRRLTFVSFGMNMDKLFEGYVRSVFDRAFPSCSAITERARKFPLSELGTNICLDVFLNQSGKKVVGECKNKIVIDPDTKVFQDDLISLKDIYQVVAYATHEKVRATSAFLVYPIVSSGSNPIALARTLHSFAGCSGHTLPVHIFLIDLCSKTSELVTSIRNISTILTPSLPE